MSTYIDTCGLGDGSKACRVVVSYLRKDAWTWWRSFCKDDIRFVDNLALDELLDAMTDFFRDIDYDMKLR